MKPSPAARLVPVPPSGLPGWCDRFMPVAGEGEFFASRAWYEALLRHALPAEAHPLLALCGESEVAMLPLMESRGRLSALASPYTLDWRPLPAPGATTEALEVAGRALGGLLRLRPPVRLDTLDPAAPGFAALQTGFARAGLRPLSFLHTGNWHEVLPEGTTWSAYLAGRPSALRTTVARKLARAQRETEFELVRAPGPRLEAGIAAYEEVRARSWKPQEPFPDFDGALMRVVAAFGLLRLGVLRAKPDGSPVAAQYWILDQGGRRATVLKLSHVEESRAGSPGTVLTAQVVRSLLEDDAVTELDFGRGDDPYKRLWAGVRRQRIGVILAHALHPAGAVAILRHSFSALRRGVERNQ